MEFKHIILVNSEALQQVAFDVTVNMERMLNRRIPDMDIRKWLYAAACDGCVPQGEAVKAVFVGNGDMPGNIEKSGIQIGKQFEFLGFEFVVEKAETAVSASHTFVERLEELLASETMEKIVCVPGESLEQYTARILSQKPRTGTTVLSVEQLRGAGFSWQFLSCSVCYAAGVTDEEIRNIDSSPHHHCCC